MGNFLLPRLERLGFPRRAALAAKIIYFDARV
jgi:hypothetical protein